MNELIEQRPLQLSIVSDTETFAGMTEEWRVLGKQASASFFMNWEWHYTWWQVYATPSDRLYLVRFTLDDKLVGLLPMYSRRPKFALKHRLMFLGTGEPVEDEVATEYLDLISHPDHQQEVADAAIDWLSSCKRWGTVELRYLLDDALLVQAYRARAELVTIERNVGNRYRVPLELSEEAHLENISKSRSKRMERSRRALVRDGGFEQISVTGAAELDKAFHYLAELNHERQAHKQRKSVFASDKFNQFHRLLIQLVIEHGGVNIHQFKLKHSLLAVIYCFYDENTCYYYQSGFSKRAANKYMPLTFAHLAEIQRNRGMGRRYYDFMRAEPPSYKEDFGCETTPMVTTFIFRSRWHLFGFNTRKIVRRKLVTVLNTFGINRNLMQ